MKNDLLKYFGTSLNQIFIYITYQCNYKCAHCLIGDRINDKFTKDQIFTIFTILKEKGCKKVTILGGEPTLHKDILEILEYAFKLGLNITLDTNGSFPINMWNDSRFHFIDTFCFSIDGHRNQIHDEIRGKGSFTKVLQQVELAKKNNKKIKFTHTVTNLNITYILDMINFSIDLNIDELNFHVATINGRAKYQNNFKVVSPELWYLEYQKIVKLINDMKSDKLPTFRIPPRYCTKDQLHGKFKDHKCLNQIRDRMLILPPDKSKGEIGGPVYLCGLLISEKTTLGFNNNGNFIQNNTIYSENNIYIDPPIINGTPICPLLFSNNTNPNHYCDKQLFPLCISYKPSLYY